MMKKFLSAFALTACCSTTHASAATTEKAVKLYQTHFFLGKCEMTVARDAFRLDNAGNFKFVVVAKAPDWTVSVYRNDDKTYFSEKLAIFADTGVVSEYLVARKERLIDPRAHIKSEMNLSGFKIVRMTASRQTIKYLPLDRALNAPPQVESIAHGLYKMPTNGGLPISYSATANTKDFFGAGQGKGSLQVYLDTTKIETVEVAPAYFEVPKGYKKAVSVRSVVSGKHAVEQSEDALETFGRDVEQPKK